MTFKSFMKIVAGLFGSLIMTIGVTVFFLGLVFINVDKNVDRIDDIVKDRFTGFMESNREEVRQIALEQMSADNKNIEFRKDDMVTACANRAMLNEEAKAMLTEDFCGNVASMSDDDMRDSILDRMIELNKDKFLAQMSSASGGSELKKPITAIKEGIGSVMYPLYLGIMVALLGVLLTFASAGFSLLDGLYKATSKLAISVASFGVMFTALRLIKPDVMLSWAMKSSDVLKSADVQNVPPAILRIIADVVLNWIRLSTDPLIPIAFLAALPFAAIAVLLLIRKRRKRKEAEGSTYA